MAIATLTSKGQTTIPKDVRDRLALKPGDRIEFVVLPDRTIRLVPVNLPVTALRGMLPRPKRAVSVAEMNRAIAAAASRKFRRR
jgi:AbrB family looped-hinge helix DNA binding protein